MNKISRYVKNYLLYGSLLVIALFIWSLCIGYFSPHTLIENSNIIVRMLHELLSYNFILWVAAAVLYMIFLVVIPSVRDKALRRLANLHERDEREEYITGKAARASYIATLSLTLFLLFFSLFSFNLSKIPQTDPQKPTHLAVVSFYYNFFNQSDNKKSLEEQENIIFASKNFSASNSTLLMILLGWQLLTFNLAAKREDDYK